MRRAGAAGSQHAGPGEVCRQAHHRIGRAAGIQGLSWLSLLSVRFGERRGHSRDSLRAPRSRKAIYSAWTMGVVVDGYYGDSAITVPVGEIPESAQRLLRVTEEALELAIEKVRLGNRLGDVSATVQRHVEEERLLGGEGVCGPRDRAGAARGAAGSQFRPARPRAGAEARDGFGHRTHGERRWAWRCECWTITGLR